MVRALEALGWTAEVVFYSDEDRPKILEEVKAKADAYVSRINPGNIPGGEAMYFDMLRELCEAGVLGLPHPDAMIGYGAKDSLCKLTDTGLVPKDTVAYYTVEELETQFPKLVRNSVRVLKQNRGSTGEGIWRVEVVDEREFPAGEALPLDAKLKCTEAKDNHVEYLELGEFMKFCHRYLGGEHGMIVDMPFLPRIKEGEIRILLVGAKPIFVVHKKPAEGADAFSATLFSGARYTYDPPEQWAKLVNGLDAQLELITKRLGGFDLPLIWTCDFILDWDENKEDVYILGEINCSCVGFTSHLESGIQEAVAEEIIRQVKKNQASSSAQTEEELV